MNRRFRNPAFQGVPLPPAQMQTLNRANALLANGQPGQAAPIFGGLAAELEAANHPRRAANVHAQAAHAYADAGQGPNALAQSRAALNLFIQNQMVQRTPVFYANITRKLNNKGMKAAADALAAEYGGKIGSVPAAAAVGAAPVHHGKLPTNCAKCGAPIHGDDLNWVDDQTVECDYCGSLIRAE